MESDMIFICEVWSCNKKITSQEWSYKDNL